MLNTQELLELLRIAVMHLDRTDYDPLHGRIITIRNTNGQTTKGEIFAPHDSLSGFRSYLIVDTGNQLVRGDLIPDIPLKQGRIRVPIAQIVAEGTEVELDLENLIAEQSDNDDPSFLSDDGLLQLVRIMLHPEGENILRGAAIKIAFKPEDEIWAIEPYFRLFMTEGFKGEIVGFNRVMGEGCFPALEVSCGDYKLLFIFLLLMARTTKVWIDLPSLTT